MSARRLLFLLGASMTSVAVRADPLSIEPLVGVSAEYATNPFLLNGGAHGVDDEALSVDAPIRYDLDSAHYALLPSVRYSDKGSYSSLDSNFFHLKGTASISSDLQTLSFSAGARRDSSLQQYALASNGVGVRTDSLDASADWQRALTERFTIEAGVNFSRALYNDAATKTGLVNYRYLNEFVLPKFLLSERDTVQLIVSSGQYESLDGITASHSAGAQLGFSRRLDEIWTFSATTGYSKADNSESIYLGPFIIDGYIFGPYYVGLAKFVQRGPIFSAGIKRKGETMTLSADASRSYAPTGFEYLSRQDLVELDLNQDLSERWSYLVHLSYENSNTPSLQGSASISRYYSGRFSATWHWTPQWTLSLTTTWIGAKYAPPPASAQSTNVALQFAWQFGRIDLYL